MQVVAGVYPLGVVLNICWRVEAEKFAVGVLCLLLMSGEAVFDEAKGEVEAHWQIHLGGQGQGAGHC